MTGEQDFVVDGLNEPVEVLIDHWGVPHIFARSKLDAFVAQGFNAARDRLFQIDLWRRRGLGRLAEVFGEAYVESDRAARLFLYRGQMHNEWLAYGSNTKSIVTAFVRGINSFVVLCEQRPELLPPEFGMLRYAPARWDPEDVPRIRSHGLVQNVEQEVARARTVGRFGPAVEDLRRRREPAADLVVPPGLDPSIVPEGVLDIYRLATAAVNFAAAADFVAAAGFAGRPVPAGDTVPVGRADPAGRAAGAISAATPPAGQGSNNWVVAGTRTATGRPLLANDPHRMVTLPSLRYLAHLSAPGLDVIGAGEPALPGVSIGHNARLAFGLTIFAVDQEDLYVYETHPDDAARYRYGDGWETMQTRSEEIPVAGGDAVAVEMRFTRHGPVIFEDPSNHTAFALRTAWLEPGMAPYLGSIEYMNAPSAEAFVEAMNRWGAPGENQVYADVDGNIGWRPAGLVPIRPNWDGTMPVPGDGRYEWAGFYDMDQLPSRHNPAEGWIATANEMNLPDDYPNAERTMSYDWSPASRFERIAEVLASSDRLTVADCVRLQTDCVSLPARHILPLLEGFTSGDPSVAAAVELLRGWNGDERADSAATPLFEIWYRRHLRAALLSAALRHVVRPEEIPAALRQILPIEDRASDPRVDLALLSELAGVFPGEDGRVPSSLLEASLAAAMAETERLLGPDPSTWQWGALHRAYLDHPLSALPELPPWSTIGPAARGGSGDTVGAAPYSPDFVQQSGATFRVVMDVGDWDRSVAMNSPGQSGDPRSTHYADLFEDWAGDGAFPLLYTRAAIEANVSSRHRLLPTSKGAR